MNCRKVNRAPRIQTEREITQVNPQNGDYCEKYIGQEYDNYIVCSRSTDYRKPLLFATINDVFSLLRMCEVFYDIS